MVFSTYLNFIQYIYPSDMVIDARIYYHTMRGKTQHSSATALFCVTFSNAASNLRLQILVFFNINANICHPKKTTNPL